MKVKKKTTANKKTSKKRKKRRSPVKVFVSSALIVIAVGYIAVGAYLYINQRKFLYFPQPGVLSTTEQTIEIPVGTVTLRGWVVNQSEEDAVIYFGGNAERPEASLEDFKYLFDNQAVYILNYRGYGESDGSPTEKNLCSDAMAIYDRIVLSHNNISVIGRSLGSGVAVYLAAQRKVHKLVLVTPFNCLADIAQGIYPVFPMRLMMKDKYDSEQIAPVITAQTLIIKAENDEVIPAESTDRLISAFNKNYLETTIIPEAGHNNIQDYTQYYMLLRDFINEPQ